MVEELCTSQAMSRTQLDLFFLCWVDFSRACGICFKCWHTLVNCVQDSCVVCQILHVSFIFAKARRHMPQTWRDTSRYERLVFFSCFMGLRLELYGAQYSLSVTRRPPLGTRCCHQQYCSHKTAEVVVCICMHCGHTQHPSRCCTCHALFLHTLVVRVYHIGHDWSFWFVVCLEAHSYVCTCRDVCVHWRFTLLKHSSA